MTQPAPIVSIRNLVHEYTQEGKPSVMALRGIDLEIAAGEYISILGHNGCGKSTLARHLNALLLPTSGEVHVDGHPTNDRANLRNLRSTVGMVFQIPDNQFVATIVEEDVAFGPENLGIPHDQLLQRVDWALTRVGMLDNRHRAPHMLSGGQKQRVCVAGVLAMKPRVLVLDEATAMLDPLGRKEVLAVVRRMNDEDGTTVVAITHHMEEALEADRVIVMSEGRIVLQGTPREVFARVDELHALELDVPQPAQLAHALGLPSALTVDEVVATLQSSGTTFSSTTPDQNPVNQVNPALTQTPPSETVISLSHLVHYYMRSTPLEVKAISDINIEVMRGEVLGIIGHTGSGKSTAVQHMNGLYRPHEGSARVLDMDLSAPNINVKKLRQRVGLVFQSPEAQLFEQYVGDDIAYGPRNLKLERDEVRARVRQAMEDVGLGFDEFKDRITFSLSGGQMRRVAIAGVLALHPEVLVLDEPTAGLDPLGRTQLWERLLALRTQRAVTLVVISHNMEDLATICDRVVVISEGRTLTTGTPRAVFGEAAKLREIGLDVPPITELGHRLGLGTVLSVSEALARLRPPAGAGAAVTLPERGAA